MSDHGALSPSERKKLRMTGGLRKAREPAPEPGTREAPPPSIPTEDRTPRPASAPAVTARPAVPDNFAHTDRTRLRVQALEFALRGGELLRARVGTGAEILAEAEQIERWIAEPIAKETP